MRVSLTCAYQKTVCKSAEVSMQSSDLELTTRVQIPNAPFMIYPSDRLLFVGSCFAAEMGKRFSDDAFLTTVNPYGVMYNPASILHTIDKYRNKISKKYRNITAVFTLGTNHVYILKETGEIVDNCQKRPASLFMEKELEIDECVNYLEQAIVLLHDIAENVKTIITVSPIRYKKYGYHESRLSKAILLLAADRVVKHHKNEAYYFPAYELMNDELRDYRFYKPDMLHPSDQAVDYIHQHFCNAVMSDDARLFSEEWRPIRQALNHRPLEPQSESFRQFLEQTRDKERKFKDKWAIEE